jgi:hypothetical protein
VGGTSVLAPDFEKAIPFVRVRTSTTAYCARLRQVSCVTHCNKPPLNTALSLSSIDSVATLFNLFFFVGQGDSSKKIVASVTPWSSAEEVLQAFKVFFEVQNL